MPEEDKREVVVVTGGSAGCGRAIVEEFARHKAKIAVLARGEDRLVDTVLEVTRLGGEAIAIPTDVADAESVDRAASKTEERFGPIDIWVNCAMASMVSQIRDMEPQEFKRVTEVTYLGVVWGTMSALKRMLTRDRGAIIQIGSALAYRSIPLQSAYCGAKSAIRGFTDSLRSEIIHNRSNIKVSMVQMPAMNTPQFDWIRSRLPRKAQPVPPIYQPDVAARAVYFAAHHHPRELFVGFSTLEAIWGQKIVPGTLDRYLADKAWEGQMTGEADDPDRPDNLFEPVTGHFGAHGRFDDRSKTSSFESWLAEKMAYLGL